MQNAILVAVGYLLQGLEEFVNSTEVKWDNLVADILRTVYESEVVRDWLAGILSTPPDVMTVIVAPQEVVEEFNARDIPWQRVIELLPQIISLLRMLLGK